MRKNHKKNRMLNNKKLLKKKKTAQKTKLFNYILLEYYRLD